MTLAHFVYIPGVLLVGIVIGYVLGGRAAMAAQADRRHRDQRRIARQARAEAGGEASAPEPSANQATSADASVDPRPPLR